MAFESLKLPEQVQAGLKEIVEAFSASKIRYALIGGFAVGYRSQPRSTKDLDFILEIPQLKLPSLLEDLGKRGFTIDEEKTIQEWTQYHLTKLEFQGLRIDWLKPVIPLYKHVIDKSKTEIWLGCSIPIATPEGLILTKLISFRGQDLVDIENLLAANPGELDIDYVRSEWSSIATDEDSRMKWFLEMAAKFHTPLS